MTKILFTGGGTGGHIFPIIAVARELRRIWPDKNLQFYFLGPKNDFDEIFLSQEGIKIKKILAGKIRRYLNWKSALQNLADMMFLTPAGMIQSLFYLFFLSPDLIFTKGGYGSVPGALTGWILGTPLFLHESDITPGLANRFLSKLAGKVFVSFPKTEYFSQKKMILTGNPVRREILAGNRDEAKIFFKINGGKPVILILGGSQGAQRINDKILDILPQFLRDGFEIIHQCGDKNLEEVKGEAKAMINDELKENYHLFPFLKEVELRLAYAIADFVISRAGAGSIFEIASLAKPSILVPLPESAQNHQVKNAYAYAQNGATVVLEEINFTPHFFLEKIKYLFSHPKELEKMSLAAKAFAKPAASLVIAQELLAYLTKP